MNRADLQRAVEDSIEKVRAIVERRKGPRNAMRVGAYGIGGYVFACLDGEHVVVVDAPAEEADRCIRSESDMAVSYDLDEFSADTLNALLAIFREVATLFEREPAPSQRDLRCDSQKDRLHVPKKGGSHAEKA